MSTRRVAGLDVLHHVQRSGAADHEELLAVGLFDRGQHADALVVVVVPDRVDVRCGLEEVRGDVLARLGGELRGDAVGHLQAVYGQCVLEAP